MFHGIKRLISIAGVALICLSGCAAEESRANQDAAKAYMVHKISFMYAYEFRLDDGTRCVVSARGGVDCDWGRHQE